MQRPSGWSGSIGAAPTKVLLRCTMQLLTVLRRRAYNRTRGIIQAGISQADISEASWYKSAFSQLNGSCVEISRLLPDRIGVRDTKDNGTGPVLIFTGAEWDAFIAGAKEGQFDNL